MSDYSTRIRSIMLVIIAIIILLPFWFNGCTDADDARRILRQSGYTGITITGHAFLQCGKDDYYSTGFLAVSPSGEQVSGTVCKGLFFKSSTIRLD